MIDTPEPLSAIIAEMRKAVVPMICGRPKIESVSIRDVLQWADRIEAAAERERVEREFAHKNVEEALSAEISIRDEKIKQSAPGNAAVLREALERIVGWCEGCHADACEKVCRPGLTSESIHAALAALAAPARNCDRFSTAEEAYAAWQKHNSLTAICDWLFAPAEGGAE